MCFLHSYFGLNSWFSTSTMVFAIIIGIFISHTYPSKFIKTHNNKSITANPNLQITFIGLGKMGAAITERLLSLGYTVTVYNRSKDKQKPLVQQGAIAGQTLEQAVKQADIIFSCLLDDQAILDVTQQIFPHLKTNSIHVCLATIKPRTATQLNEWHAEKNLNYISATVLGIPNVAKRGELTTFFAGKSKNTKKIEPILQAFSSKIINLGDHIQAPNIMKICMNYSLMTALELISELYVFAENSGLDKDMVRQGLHYIYGHPAFKLYIDKIYHRDFDHVNFNMVGGKKDVDLFIDSFKQASVEPKLAEVAQARFQTALANHMQDKDWCAIYEVIK